MREEIWCGNRIRLVWIDDYWWVVLADVCKACNLRTDNMVRRITPGHRMRVRIDEQKPGGVKTRARVTQDMTVISELGLYDVVTRSVKPEAKQLQKSIYEFARSIYEPHNLYKL